ncbi:MAG: hypothetical protein K0S09_57 [Sphingobacteriaceae bacterium]|jgi:hypothetical protein|nr:hypothetical protein [Sphingobacteriaceae bacterium]
MRNISEYILFCELLDIQVEQFNAVDDNPMNRLNFLMAINKARSAAFEAFTQNYESEVSDAA